MQNIYEFSLYRVVRELFFCASCTQRSVKVIKIEETISRPSNYSFRAAPLPDRNYLPPSTSYGTPDLGSVGSNEVSAPSASYGTPATSYDPPPAGTLNCQPKFEL